MQTTAAAATSLPPLWLPQNAGDFWAMVSAIATILAFVSAGVYVYLTYRQVSITRAMLEREDKPLLRLSAVYRAVANPRRSVVNMGRGVALSSVIVETPDKYRFLWTISHGKRSRLEDFDTSLGVCYSIYFQDIAGRWYLTKATPQERRTHNEFVGIIKAANVPSFVREEAQISPV